MTNFILDENGYYHLANGSNNFILDPNGYFHIDNNKLNIDNGKIISDGNGNLTVNSIKASNGATGTFTSADGKTITVTSGIITSIA